MAKKAKVKRLLAIGIASIAMAAILFFVGDDTNEKNIEIARNATNAYEAASQIARNNRTDMFVSLGKIALLSFGGTLTIFSTILLLKRSKE